MLSGLGIKNAQGQPIDAKIGSIQGSVSLTATGTAVVNAGDFTVPWRVAAPLTKAMQSVVGVYRYIVAVSADVIINTVLPPEFNNKQVFADYIKQVSRIGMFVGGVPEAYYSFAQLEDTRFMQRALSLIIKPDSTLFATFAFVLERAGFFFEPPTSDSYNVTLNVVTYWSDTKP